MEGVAVGVPVVLGVHQIVDTRPWVVFEQVALGMLSDYEVFFFRDEAHDGGQGVAMGATTEGVD